MPQTFADFRIEFAARADRIGCRIDGPTWLLMEAAWEAGKLSGERVGADKVLGQLFGKRTSRVTT